MLSAAVIITAAVVAGPMQFQHEPRQGGRILATPAPFVPNRADDVRRPGFNGRVWVSRAFTNTPDRTWDVDAREPGTAYYGAVPGESSRVYARVDQLVVSYSPWQRLGREGQARLEQARNDWLQERGYTGGVRTFINDHALRRAMAEHARASAATPAAQVEERREIRPRAVIELAPDVPRFRSRMQVRAE